LRLAAGDRTVDQADSDVTGFCAAIAEIRAGAGRAILEK